MIYVIFIIFWQITELQKDRVKVATAMTENVLANPDKGATKLIRAAQEDYESEYFFFYTQVCDVCEHYLDIPEDVFPSIS